MERPFPAYTGSEPYLFVSYAHRDAGLVYPEIAWLHDQGMHLWYDEGISPGAEFPEELARAIEGAALVVYYISPESIASRHCRDEIHFALDRKRPVLALHIQPTDLTGGMALSLGTSQAILRHELSESDYRQHLVDGIQRLTSASPGRQARGARPVRVRSRRRLVSALVILAVVAIAAAGVFQLRQYLDDQAQSRWVRHEAIPEIKQMLALEWRDLSEPFALAVKAEAILPDDPEVIDALEKTSLRIDITTEPAGAEVYAKLYSRPNDPWQYLGTTPLSDERLAVSYYRWRLEKPGYQTVEAMHSTWTLGAHGPLLQSNNLQRVLTAEEEVPAGMVAVAGGPSPLGDIPDFFIDRYEVTNRQYKAFMDAGGYEDKRWWQHPFLDQGVLLDHAAALAEFVDLSGRPGPATWLGGTYPEDEADHPVSGVSWFEAAAYARYSGRALPTSVHWGLARGDNSTLILHPQLGGLGVIAPFSNFNRQATVPAGAMKGFTTWGVYDMAGNVAEWCSNQTAQGRVLRGGSYDDNTYEFAEPSQAPPMKRTPGFGFRTVAVSPGVPEEVYAETSLRRLRLLNPEPTVSDEVFQSYLQRFEYDPTDLNAQFESRDTTSEQWVLERYSINTAYDDERMAINLFLPSTAEPPYQTVVYFPGTGSVYTASSERIAEYYEFPIFLSFLVNSGRAVIYPVYKGTFERGEERLIPLHFGSQQYEYSDYLIKLVRDFRRTIDYLETRPDIDEENIAYYGMSWGGLMGSIIPAIEPRVKTSMLLAAGMPEGKGVSNPIHYAPRITSPTLIMVGRYDTMLDYENSAVPLYESLGTAPEHKMLKVYETDHIPPKREFVTEMLSWLDRYLGEI